MAHPHNGPPQPTLVTQRLGKRYGCVQDVVEPSIFAERQERPIQMLAEINGLLQRVAALREVLQGYQRLLQAGHGFLVGGTLHGISGGVAQILHGAVRVLGTRKMHGEDGRHGRGLSPIPRFRAETNAPV